MPNRKEKKHKLSREEVKDLVEMLRHLLDAYGFFAEKLGEIQETHEEAYEYMFSLESAERLPEALSLMAEKAPELGKLFTSIFVRITTYMPRVNRLMVLSAEEKIRLGKNLRTLAEDIGKLLNWIEKEVD